MIKGQRYDNVINTDPCTAYNYGLIHHFQIAKLATIPGKQTMQKSTKLAIIPTNIVNKSEIIYTIPKQTMRV
jgi:hypothetical protein